ncbi:MAG: indolepyruvate oxidoreductase subunit beta [Planctomycetota bacterium]
MNTGNGRCNPRGWRIVIAGTGGQGVVTAARLLCECFAERGHEVVSGQLHGMAQRGGAVQSSVIIDGGISPIIPSGRADFVVGLEPVETVRALPLMSSQTTVYMNTTPVIPFVLAQRAVREEGGGEYPEVAELVRCVRAVTDNLFSIDAAQRAAEAGGSAALNMVMLGCLLGSAALPCTADAFSDFVAARSPSTLREANVRAFRTGVKAVNGRGTR